MSHSVESTKLNPKNELSYVVASVTEVGTGQNASVSVVIPCFNEQRFISTVLLNLANQYDRERYEIIVVDGNSTDRTRQVVNEFARSNPDLRVRIVHNPARHIPTALNLGIAAAVGEVIVRMDAHSVPSDGYVRRCVEHLSSSTVSVVGMPWHIKSGADSAVARSIALAVAHPFGIGDAQYRLQTVAPQIVDTVPFGAFKKSLWRELGGFNEDLLANEDYDFNYRVRKRGGQVLLDPAEHCDYYARSTVRKLAGQYSRYGHWKAQMIKLHPRSLRVRHLVAPSLVVYLLVFGLLSIWWSPAFWAFLAVLGAYVVLAAFFALSLASRAREWKLFPIIIASFFSIHGAWGLSFLRGLVTSGRR